MSATDKYAVGTLVFVRDPEMVWRPAEIIGVKDGVVTIQTEGDGEVRTLAKGEPVFLRNIETYSTEGLVALDDLTQLTHLHEAAVLDSLNVRFDIDKIYTFTGPILIAVNPFKLIPGMYDFETLREFISSKPVKRPHVFATANGAYRGLCERERSQTVLISGESGAGKTETTKFVMKFLTLAGSRDENNKSTVEKQVLESNPLLEAFGNARTLRNDNSSRFGKFIELQFKMEKDLDEGKRGRVCGARIHTYLLEKVRVVDQQEGERNYHIFYQLCAAAAAAAGNGGRFAVNNDVELDLSLYSSHDTFKYLTKSSCYELNGVDDVEQFQRTLSAMETVGIGLAEQLDILRVIGGVLYLGNILFERPQSNSEASQIAGSVAPFFEKAAQLLGVDPKRLEDCLCYRTIRTKGESFMKPLQINEAEESRDALSRALYGTLFLRIVQKTNRSIGYNDKVKLMCGVLDIFGFECFTFNSFEQLCINFTNERLQQFFNTFVFKCEEELYQKEGISWDPLDFPDNQDCVEILQDRPHGIFAMLDEECIVPAGSDRGFCSKVIKQHSGHRRFAPVKTKPNWFTVNHFAGPVLYCSDGFLDKNKDQLYQDVQDCVKSSSLPYVSSLFSELLSRGAADPSKEADPRRTMKKQNTVSSEFKDQLGSLMDFVRGTEPHFIRCVKPNSINQPDEFERKSVNEQLRYGGVLQAVQVSRAGYPVRISHVEFFEGYVILAERGLSAALRKDATKSKQARMNGLASPGREEESRARGRVKTLLEHLDQKLPMPRIPHSTTPLSWAVGNTLVFLKQEAFEALSSSRLKLRSRCAVMIQARYKAFVAQRVYKFGLQCVKKIQALLRGKMARVEANRRRKQGAAVCLQTFIRTKNAMAKYKLAIHKLVRVQSLWRGMRARQHYVDLVRHDKAAKIQAAWRGKRARVVYAKLKKAAKIAQLKWRSILARRQLRRLKQEAKEAGALLAKIQQLQQELNAARKAAGEAEAKHHKLMAEVNHKEGVISTLRDEQAELNAKLEKANQERVEYESELAKLKELTTQKPDVAVLRKQPSISSSPTAVASVMDMKRALGSSQQQTLENPQGQNDSLPGSPKAVVVDTSGKKFGSIVDVVVADREAKLAEKEAENKALQESLEKTNEEKRKMQEEFETLKNAYNSLLKSSTIATGAPVSSVPSSALLSFNAAFAGTQPQSASPSATITPQRRGYEIKTTDILLVGAQGVGKSQLLANLMVKAQQSETAKKVMQEATAPSGNQFVHFYTGVVFSKPIKFADSTGDPRYHTVVKEHLGRSSWVFVVYDMWNTRSFDEAHQWTRDAISQVGKERVIVIGSKAKQPANNAPPAVDMMEVRNFAAQMGVVSMESDDLWQPVHFASQDLNPPGTANGPSATPMAQHPSPLQAQVQQTHVPWSAPTASASSSQQPLPQPSSAARREEEERRSMGLFGTVTGALQSLFVPTKPRAAQSQQVLVASMRGTPGQKKEKKTGGQGADGLWADLRPVQELQESDSAITCVAFGQERLHRAYCLMACASKDGTVVLYRMYRTEMELSMLKEEDFPRDDTSLLDRNVSGAGSDHGLVAISARLTGHSRAVTSIFFTLLEDQLVTTSIDKSVRFWNVETGEMIKVFTDSSPALVAAFLPFNPQVFVAANSNAVLRLVNVQNGLVSQKLKVESEVRALKFDDTGLFCLAGTKNGSIHVLEASDNATLKFKFKHQLARGAITCITFVPSTGPDSPPCLLVNSCDSSVTIIDCIYGPQHGVLSNLNVRHRVKVAHSLLPLRCCYSSYGGGFLISASEDKEVYVYSLAKGANYKMQYLKHHQAPVLAVATNHLDTLLASADSLGRVVLWRRFDFSNLGPGE